MRVLLLVRFACIFREQSLVNAVTRQLFREAARFRVQHSARSVDAVAIRID